eukprot:1136811-Pelagomonas_calceolata.AAC.8
MKIAGSCPGKFEDTGKTLSKNSWGSVQHTSINRRFCVGGSNPFGRVISGRRGVNAKKIQAFEVKHAHIYDES